MFGFRRKRRLEFNFGYGGLPSLFSDKIRTLPLGAYEITLTSAECFTKQPIKHTILGDDIVAVWDHATHIAKVYGMGRVKIKVRTYNKQEMIEYSERALRKLGVSV